MEGSPPSRRSRLSTWADRQPALGLVKETLEAAVEDRLLRLGAALSYYTVFALAPLLVLGVALGALLLGAAESRTQVAEVVRALAGPTAAATVEEMLARAQQPPGRTGVLATLAGFAAMLLGAGAAFGQLQEALNRIWGAQTHGRGWRGFVRDRVLSFVMVLGAGLLILGLLVTGAFLGVLSEQAADRLDAEVALVWRLFYVSLTFAVTTLLFAAMYKVLPDTRIAWQDVAVGAPVTAALFTLSQSVIGAYLGRSTIASLYGAAGTLVVLLLWVYFSAQIVLLGAEFTWVYARRRGSRRVRANA